MLSNRHLSYSTAAFEAYTQPVDVQLLRRVCQRSRHRARTRKPSTPVLMLRQVAARSDTEGRS